MASIQMVARAGIALSQTDLIPKEALSGIFGSISLATWICLMLPQLWLNFQQSSADALSLPFLFVWMVGDITNLAGAIWAGLVPTVIAIAVYFCFADVLLISQCLYYNNLNASRADRQQSVSSAISEDEPLLSRRRSSENVGLPGSRRRRSSALSGPRRDSLSKITEEEEVAGKSEWVLNTVWILGVITLGTAGWVIAWQAEVWTPQPEHGKVPEANQVAYGASILGYISALCYLGARLPQIYQNYQTKSVEGLSILFFMLSMMGNTTYGAGILFHSQDADYLLTNLPWLIGSIGTIVQDCVIFAQFQVYKPKKPTTEAIE